jgi:Xaa-Pro aminopeptidase
MPYPSQVPYSWEVRSKYLDLPFPISEYERRLERLREIMEDFRLDSVLIFGNAADYGGLVYLSNFLPFGRAAIVVSKNEEIPPILVTDAILHGEPINSYAWMTWFREFIPVAKDAAAFAKTLKDIFESERAKRIGLVGLDNFPMSIWEELRKDFSADWVNFGFEFLSIKSVRSDAEIALQREVGRITAAAMRSAVESIFPGKTESEIVAAGYKTMFEEGAHDRSFQTIVNSGPRGGLKHSYPTNRKIQLGDLIYLDMGAMKFGYQCDMSRSVVVGGANAEQKQVLDVILNAYQTLMSEMHPGVKTSELISIASKLEEQSGLRKKYAGRIYLGLIVHHAIATSFFELPSLGLPDVTLEKNMSFAFEPMAHILDFGTAVIEDTVLITKGGAESLTPYEIVHW